MRTVTRAASLAGVPGLLATLCTVLGSACGGGGDAPLTIELSREDLQKRVDAKFPVEKEKFLSKVVLSEPKVVLEPGRDDIGIDLKVTLDLPMLDPYTGRVVASGDLSYVREEKAFYLRNPELREVELEGLPPEHVERAKKPIEAVAKAALEVFPVFEFEQRNLKEVAAEHVLRRVTVREGKVIAEIGMPFEG